MQPDMTRLTARHYLLTDPVDGVFNKGECDFIETTYEMWFQQLASEVYTCRNVDSSRAVINSGGYSFAFDSCYTGSVSYRECGFNTLLEHLNTRNLFNSQRGHSPTLSSTALRPSQRRESTAWNLGEAMLSYCLTKTLPTLASSASTAL